MGLALPARGLIDVGGHFCGSGRSCHDTLYGKTCCFRCDRSGDV